MCKTKTQYFFCSLCQNCPHFNGIYVQNGRILELVCCKCTHFHQKGHKSFKRRAKAKEEKKNTEIVRLFFKGQLLFNASMSRVNVITRFLQECRQMQSQHTCENWCQTMVCYSIFLRTGLQVNASCPKIKIYH